MLSHVHEVHPYLILCSASVKNAQSPNAPLSRTSFPNSFIMEHRLLTLPSGTQAIDIDTASRYPPLGYSLLSMHCNFVMQGRISSGNIGLHVPYAHQIRKRNSRAKISNDMSEYGDIIGTLVYSCFCTAWEPFRDLIPEKERGCFIDAYYKRLNSDDLETQHAAAKEWTKWEMGTAHLLLNEEAIKRGEDDSFSLAFARIENHYFFNKGFFPSDSFLIDNVDKIRHIKTTIVQGRYDVVCPMMSAWDLHKAWPEADLKVVPDAGHSANEPGIGAELVAVNEMFKRHYQE